MKPKNVLAVIAVFLVVLAGPAAAQDTSPGEGLGGYSASAAASAISFQPFLPALVSTGDVPFEGTVGLATGRVKSGGNAAGHAAVVWPGSAAANLGPLIAAGFGEEELGALVPSWPLQAHASQTDGEVETSIPPAIVMTARGFPDEAAGDTRFVDVDIPQVMRIDEVASTSSTIVTDGDVTSVARVAMKGVSLFGGQITVESIRSIARTHSTGAAATSSGDVDIVGMRIGGFEVSVTDRGFEHAGAPGGDEAPGGAGEPVPGEDPESAIASVLEALGVRLTMFESSASEDGGRAERFEPGLIVSVDNPVGGEGPIPPGRFDIILASTSSSALATPAFTVDVSGAGDIDSPAAPAPTPRSSIGSGPEVSRSTVGNVGSSLSEAAASSGGGSTAPDVIDFQDSAFPQGTDYEFGGVPLTLAVVLLLVAALAARYIRRFFDRIMEGS